MRIYTIERKMSGTGSVHDIASEHYDREIKFRKGTKFAVILSSFYGDYYTTHKTQKTAARQSYQTKKSHKIIDSDGNYYQAIDPETLINN